MKKLKQVGARRLQFESLEDRQVMAAGLTASLAGGVLTVSGTKGADAVNFRQAGGWLVVNGINNAWSTGQINLVVVQLGAGDDTVSMNGLTENLLVVGGGGTDRVKFANGQEVSFNSGASLTVWGGNYAKLGGNVVYDQRGTTPPNPQPAPPNPQPAPPTPTPPAAPTATTSGLTATLWNGTLTITGNDGANLINIKQAGGWIAVDGIYNAWTNYQVNNIVVQLKRGNDVVRLNGLTETISIVAGGGTKVVRFGSGHEISFSGSKDLLTVWGGKTAKLNGVSVPTTPTDPQPEPAPENPANNWFTANIADAALRSLGATLYADSIISRSDILAMFESAEDNGVVDAVELADLRKIVSTTTLFVGAEHVWKLASYVVTTHAANAQYAGQALGNLAAGSSSAHLEKLVNKWFLGLDRPAASGTYRQIAGQLFVNGPSYSDIKQGAVGDCYFVMSLAEVAQQNASIINNMFIVNGDGTYTVKFYNGGQSHYVTVDSYLPTNALGQLLYAGRGQVYSNSGNELWTALAEKAYVQLNEFGWVRPTLPGSGQNSYESISGGYIYAALGHITGQSTVSFTMTSGSSSFSSFVSAYNAGKMIGFASKGTPASSSVVGGHAYSVASYNAATQQITLFNPWGTEYGMVTMTWSQIQGSFLYFDRTA